jgi:NADPH-dependent ferric siderophore reductase
MTEPKRRGRRVTRLGVLRTEWVTPHLVRVVAGGPGLAGYVDNGFTDRYVKIIFRRPDVEYQEPLDMDVVHETLPREQWPVLRTYTVRSVSAGELVIDFVYHGEEGLAGPWAAGLKPGDEVLFLGPGGAYSPSPDADWHLLVGDEAALPAIASALEQIPADRPVYGFVEVAGAAEELPLARPVRWVHRGAGVTLPAAVRALDFPGGTVQAFVHGEAGMVRELRRYLRFDRGVPREMLSISGYWRRGMDDEGWRRAKRAERELEEAEEAAGRASSD